jgi:hypothetical protein
LWWVKQVPQPKAWETPKKYIYSDTGMSKRPSSEEERRRGLI